MFMIDSLWERSTACFFSLWEHSRACFFSRQFCSNSCNSSWRLWSRFTNMNKFFCSSRSLIRTSDSLFSYQHILTEYNLDPSIIRRLPNCLDAFIWKIYHLLEFVCLLILSISGTQNLLSILHILKFREQLDQVCISTIIFSLFLTKPCECIPAMSRIQTGIRHQLQN